MTIVKMTRRCLPDAPAPATFAMTSVTLLLRTFVTTLFRMAVHALLLCADEKTAGAINMVLGELGISVEPCFEIFAAVKKVTTERFDTVILDCQNLENARLLLKSTRSSSQNNTAFAVAIVDAISISAVFQLGADSVLTKPIALGNVRRCLKALRKASLNPKNSPAPSKASAAERLRYSRHMPSTISGTLSTGHASSIITHPTPVVIGPSDGSPVVTGDRGNSVASSDLARDGVSQLESRSAPPENQPIEREGIALPAVQKDVSPRISPSSAVQTTPWPSPERGEITATTNQNPLKPAMPSMSLRYSLSSATLEERKTISSEEPTISSRLQNSPARIGTHIRQKIILLMLLTALLLVVSYSQRALLKAWLSPLHLGHWPVKLLSLRGNPLSMMRASGQTAIAHQGIGWMVPSPRVHPESAVRNFGR